MAPELVTEWRSKPKIPYETKRPGPCELTVGITIGVLRTRDTYNSLEAKTKSFFTCVTTFWTKLLQGRL
jgi:hypothetical protein